MRNHPYMPPRNEAWVSRCCYRDMGTETYCRKNEADPIHKGYFLPSGTAGVVTCPFEPCGKTVTLRGSEPLLVEQHKINLLADVSIAGTPCPGSLMPHPLTPEAKAAMDEQKKDLLAFIKRVDQSKTTVPFSTGKMAGPSQNLHQPGRLGREPEPKAPEWHLGGRVDEEVIPQHQTVRGKVPPGILGQPVGRIIGVSVSDTVGTARKAMNEAEDAYQKLSDCLSKIQGARVKVIELLGEGNGETLTNWLTGLQQAGKAIGDSQVAIAAANEQGDRFISNLMF